MQCLRSSYYKSNFSDYSEQVRGDVTRDSEKLTWSGHWSPAHSVQCNTVCVQCNIVCSTVQCIVVNYAVQFSPLCSTAQFRTGLDPLGPHLFLNCLHPALPTREPGKATCYCQVHTFHTSHCSLHKLIKYMKHSSTILQLSQVITQVWSREFPSFTQVFFNLVILVDCAACLTQTFTNSALTMTRARTRTGPRTPSCTEVSALKGQAL